MHAERWTTQESELEGYAVTIYSYQLCNAYVTEVESRDSGSMLARGVAGEFEESRSKALSVASSRLLRTRQFELTVGG